MFIPAIYGDLGDGLLLFYPHIPTLYILLYVPIKTGHAIKTGHPRHTLTLGIRLRRIRVEVVDATDLALEALLGSWAGHLVATS